MPSRLNASPHRYQTEPCRHSALQRHYAAQRYCAEPYRRFALLYRGVTFHRRHETERCHAAAVLRLASAVHRSATPLRRIPLPKLHSALPKLYSAMPAQYFATPSRGIHRIAGALLYTTPPRRYKTAPCLRPAALCRYCT